MWTHHHIMWSPLDQFSIVYKLNKRRPWFLDSTFNWRKHRIQKVDYLFFIFYFLLLQMRWNTVKVGHASCNTSQHQVNLVAFSLETLHKPRNHLIWLQFFTVESCMFNLKKLGQCSSAHDELKNLFCCWLGCKWISKNPNMIRIRRLSNSVFGKIFGWYL